MNGDATAGDYAWDAAQRAQSSTEYLRKEVERLEEVTVEVILELKARVSALESRVETLEKVHP